MSAPAGAPSKPVLVVGGGIGGMAAALALSQAGFPVTVIEQSSEIGEIGAGIQLGPNAFAAFDALGVGEKARGRAVYTDCLVMHDAVDESLVGLEVLGVGQLAPRTAQQVALVTSEEAAHRGIDALEPAVRAGDVHRDGRVGHGKAEPRLALRKGRLVHGG